MNFEYSSINIDTLISKFSKIDMDKLVSTLTKKDSYTRFNKYVEIGRASCRETV